MGEDMEDSLERLQIAFRSTMKAIGPQLAEPSSGLTGPQFFILDQLKQKDHCTAGELAESMGVKPSAITAMIDRLHKHEYVIRERDEHDRRIVYLRLSEEGSQTLKKVKRQRQDIVMHYLSHLTAEELESFVSIFEKLARVVPATQKE